MRSLVAVNRCFPLLIVSSKLRAFGETSLSCLPTGTSSMYACAALAAIQLDFCSVLDLPRLAQTIHILGNYDWHTQQYVRFVCAPTCSLLRCHSHTLPVCSTSCIRSSRRCLSRSANPLTFLTWIANGRPPVSLGFGSERGSGSQPDKWYGLAIHPHLYLTDPLGFQKFRYCPSAISYFQSMHVV